MYCRLVSETLSRPLTRPLLSIVTSPPASLSLATCAESSTPLGVETVSGDRDGDTSGFRSAPVFAWSLLLASSGPDLLFRAIAPINTAMARRTTAAMAYDGLVKPRHHGAAGIRF